jgi:hypothetical protein
MFRLQYLFFALFIILIAGCSDNSTGDDNNTSPQLYFSPESSTVVIGNQIDLSLKIKNLTPSIFAVSVQLHHNNSVFSFSDNIDSGSDDIFGDDALRFAQHDDSTIYLSVTRTQGQSQVEGSGTIGILELEGNSIGLDSIYIIPGQLYFYDSTGNIVTVSNIILNDAALECAASQ